MHTGRSAQPFMRLQQYWAFGWKQRVCVSTTWLQCYMIMMRQGWVVPLFWQKVTVRKLLSPPTALAVLALYSSFLEEVPSVLSLSFPLPL